MSTGQQHIAGIVTHVELKCTIRNKPGAIEGLQIPSSECYVVKRCDHQLNRLLARLLWQHIVCLRALPGYFETRAQSLNRQERARSGAGWLTGIGTNQAGLWRLCCLQGNNSRGKAYNASLVRRSLITSSSTLAHSLTLLLASFLDC